MEHDISNRELLKIITHSFSKIEDEIKEINNKLDLKADKSDIVRLEDNLETKTKALFDGYSQVYEKITAIEGNLDKENDYIFKRVK